MRGTDLYGNFIKVEGMQNIPSGANLNDYKAFGTYRCTSNNTAAGLSNSPTNLSFALVVMDILGTSGTATQWIVNYLGKMYMRSYRSGSWTNWASVTGDKQNVTRQVTATIAPNGSAAISAPTVSGYSFVAWIGVATIGWVGVCYAEGPTSASTNVWNTTSGSGTVRATALYSLN